MAVAQVAAAKVDKQQIQRPLGKQAAYAAGHSINDLWALVVLNRGEG